MNNRRSDDGLEGSLKLAVLEASRQEVDVRNGLLESYAGRGLPRSASRFRSSGSGGRPARSDPTQGAPCDGLAPASDHSPAIFEEAYREPVSRAPAPRWKLAKSSWEHRWARSRMTREYRALPFAFSSLGPISQLPFGNPLSQESLQSTLPLPGSKIVAWTVNQGE